MGSCSNFESKETQCDDVGYDHMKHCIELFSENNALVVNGGGKDKETARSMLLNQVSLMEEFEREKDEMRAKFAREKVSLKKAYENEIKDYEAEISKLQHIIDCRISEIESQYEKDQKRKEDKRKMMVEIERKNLKQSVQEQMDLVAEVESEIKRILKRLIIELKKCEPEKCITLERELCSDSLKESCVLSLKEIFNGPFEEFEEKFKQPAEGETREDELYEVGEAFRKQKKELTEIFMKEKKHLEEEIRSNCLDYRKKLDKEYEERMKAEMKVWQETIKEYEREIGILRFEREQMDRNYCIEIDRLKLESEKEKIEICAKYMKEREQLRKTLSDTAMNELLQKKTGIKSK